jgi:hypothetical protein
VVIALSIGGTVLSITTMVPAWRRLRRHGRRFMAWRTEPRATARPEGRALPVQPGVPR